MRLMTPEICILSNARNAAWRRGDVESHKILMWAVDVAWEVEVAAMKRAKREAQEHYTYSIYRINDASTRELLYIGCTCLPVEVRMLSHINTAMNAFRMGFVDESSSTAFSRSSGFFMYALGIRPLKVTVIETVQGKKLARIIESTLIQVEQPKWNTHGVPARVRENGRIAMARRNNRKAA